MLSITLFIDHATYQPSFGRRSNYLLICRAPNHLPEARQVQQGKSDIMRPYSNER
jgi:hypothetical protein